MRARWAGRDAESETLIPTPTPAGGFFDQADVAHALRGEGFDASEDGTGRGTSLVPVIAPDIAHALTRGAESAGKGGYAGRRQEDDSNIIAHPFTLAVRGRGDDHQLEYRQDGTANAILTPNGGRAGIGVGAVCYDDYNQSLSDVAHTLVKGRDNRQPHAFDGWAVRRLTPRECERLQGFPDDYTLIDVRGKPAADGPRYRALGNSMAVNVMRWIGQRIAMVDAMEVGKT